MRRYIEIYSIMMRNSLIREMSFKANFLLWMVVEVLWFCGQIVFFSIIFGNVDHIVADELVFIDVAPDVIRQRLREGKYTPGQIDTGWTKEIEEDFTSWLTQNKDRLDVPRTTIEAMIREHSPRSK